MVWDIVDLIIELVHLSIDIIIIYFIIVLPNVDRHTSGNLQIRNRLDLLSMAA